MPSHNCIIITMFSFQGAVELPKKFNEVSCFQRTSVNFLFCWWRLAGSNRWPPACKAGALPAELNPHIRSLVYQLKAQRSGFQLERKNRLAVKHGTFSSMRPAQGEFWRSGGPGLAFLRESHGGCNSPPDCCQEPPFESILACPPLELNCLGLDFPLSFFRSGGPKWTRTIDLTIISRVL